MSSHTSDRCRRGRSATTATSASSNPRTSIRRPATARTKWASSRCCAGSCVARARCRPGAVRELLAVDGELSVEQLRGMLRLRESEIAASISEQREQLRRVASYLDALERGEIMPAIEIVVKHTEAVRMAETTGVAPGYGHENIGPVFEARLPVVWARVVESGIEPGSCTGVLRLARRPGRRGGAPRVRHRRRGVDRRRRSRRRGAPTRRGGVGAAPGLTAHHHRHLRGRDPLDRRQRLHDHRPRRAS